MLFPHCLICHVFSKIRIPEDRSALVGRQSKIMGECHECLVRIIGLLPKLQSISAITGISTPIMFAVQSHPSLQRIDVFAAWDRFSLPEDLRLKAGDDAGKMSKFCAISDCYGLSHTAGSITSQPSLRRAVVDLGMRLEWLCIDTKFDES